MPSAANNHVDALLGPTNTGKTHRAIERMLEQDSGVMGLPLRLLAREVYDRVSARVGEEQVALVTGEEKRVPVRPRYWVCTVEAMPPELEVDFAAVDEIQLVSHPERGHVFTDRLLHFRGQKETWFLGSDTMERVLRAWIEGIRIHHLPRLSQLSYQGQRSLRTLPRRSAVVAFSMPDVYELADALRVRRGGAAVVLGALSPRVRNAQVAMYQAGEVDFLVATDAIGMGLNLDIHHVALSSRVKFDGFETRELDPPELAQIVGRAGRHLRDGTFGTLSPEPELSRALVTQLECHRFAAVTQGFYRNAAVDFDSIAALIESLSQKPPLPGLVAAPDADDLLVLRVLAKRDDVRALARNPHAVRLLWDVCRIPNYEKRIPEHQADHILPIFSELVQHGRLSVELVDSRLDRLDRLEGDIHQLMDRLAAVRTYTYVSHQSGWVEEQAGFRERTREIEDRLGDQLHLRLIERFVARAPSGPRSAKGQKTRREVRDPSHPFARLVEHELFEREAREDETRRARFAEALIEARFDALTLDAGGVVSFEGERVARLMPGKSLLLPGIRTLLPEWIEGGARARAERRLKAHGRDVVTRLLAPLDDTDVDTQALRGILYQLRQGLGCVAQRSLKLLLEGLTERDRAFLAERDIVCGRRSVFVRSMLHSTALTTRRALCATLLGREALEGVPDDVLAFARPRALSDEILLCLSFVPSGRYCVRCDALEDLLEQLAGVGPEDLDERLERARLSLDLHRNEAKLVLHDLETRRRRKRRKRPR